MDSFHSSAVEVIGQLRAQFPDTPFLTLGQTVLWDEPTKAAFCRILETVAPDATMMAAVHDTDYFAKLPHSGAHHQSHDDAFVLLPHNDGDTRALWSAAGELSCLFGSETVPTRAQLTAHGVAFDRVAKRYPGGERALLNQETEAWGWRAIVHTEDAPLIAADVKLRDIAPALREQLAWGFGESLQIVPQSTSTDARQSTLATAACADGCDLCLERLKAPSAAWDANEVARTISGWVDEFIQNNEAGTLSDLYRWLTPRLWCLTRGGGTCNLETSASMELFRFNRQTCKLKRFEFLDLFLNHQTRDVARHCYDEAVRGSGIYTLDQFGAGALPFDVVIPGRGRGTLRLHDASLFIETEPAITLCIGCDCGSVSELADLLERQFGPDVAIVGKAVALISMLAAEFIFVFHEKASGYTSRTQAMNQMLRDTGIALSLHPLLRLKYFTWDALHDVDATFQLPPHLARAFGQETIAAPEFATRWQSVCAAQDELLAHLGRLGSPRELLAFLSERDGEKWTQAARDYDAARKVLLEARSKTEVLEREIEALKNAACEATLRAVEIERAKGDDFRARVQPLRVQLFDIKEAAAARLNPTDDDGKPRRLSKDERARQTALQQQEAGEIAALREQIAQRQAERGHFDEAIAANREAAREARSAAREKTRERVMREKSQSTLAARATFTGLEYEAELARLRATRDALIASQSLRHIDYRPTAWWFPLVSPDGRWFRELARTAQARLEAV